MKSSCVAILVAFFAPQGKEVKDPTITVKAELGVSMRKPPKNDEWAFRDKGVFFSNSHLAVSHKVDTLSIEIFAQEKFSDLGSNDLKKVAEGEYKNISGFQGIMDPKMITASAAKLPGGGGNNAPASYLEMTFKKEEKPNELRMWVFKGSNGNLYKVIMVNEEGIYKKHARIADYILSSIQVFRPPK